MNTNQKVVGIVGSYRKNGIIDSAVTEILDAAATEGAETQKIYLQDRHIEFCTNCRVCMEERGSVRLIGVELGSIPNLSANSQDKLISVLSNFEGNIQSESL